MAEARVKVRNPMGMHARPAGRFVELAGRFESRIRVRCRGEDVDGHSILSLLMLEAVHGTELTVVAEGADAEPALAALVALIESGFGEAESYDGRGARG